MVGLQFCMPTLSSSNYQTLKFIFFELGCVMGLPVSPITASLYLEESEQKSMTTFVRSPDIWFRYICLWYICRLHVTCMHDNIVADKVYNHDHSTLVGLKHKLALYCTCIKRTGAQTPHSSRTSAFLPALFTIAVI